MEKIYLNDTLKIIAEITLEGDMTAASVVRFNYTDPDAASGFFEATIVDKRFMEYTILADVLDVAGTWSFQAYIEIDSKKYHGDTFYIEVNQLYG